MTSEALDPLPPDVRGPIDLSDPLRWRTRVLLTLAVVAVLVGGVAGASWWGSRWRPVTIYGYRVDGSTITAGMHCHPESRLLVDETVGTVRLTMEVRGKSKGDCAATVSARLRGALGERRLIDTTTGERPRTFLWLQDPHPPACTDDALHGPDGERYERDPDRGCLFVDADGGVVPQP